MELRSRDWRQARSVNGPGARGIGSERRAMKLPELLAACSTEADLRFLLIGGHAVIAHGCGTIKGYERVLKAIGADRS